MPLILTDDQQMIRDSAEGFFKDEAPVSQHRSLRDNKNPDGFSRDVWTKMAEMGFAGVLVPEAHGGADMGHVAAGIILEAMGFPTSMFTPIFALARTVGWISQWKEQLNDPQLKIGRPRQLYQGEDIRAYVDIEKR